jgi:Alpha/beta hydrolase domain
MRLRLPSPLPRCLATMAAFLAVTLVVSPAAAATGGTPSATKVPAPVVTGPITASAPPGDPSRDYPFFASNLDLAKFGYVEQEFFLQGTANRYNTPPEQTGSIIDGGHPYETRIVVRRPASASRFNGKVAVEWLNVTNGMDQEQTWYEIDQHLLRAGYAWVGVSAQRVGVNFLRTWNPGRYGTLDVGQRDGSGTETITDDALSYDIMSQVARALRAPAGVRPLGGLKPQIIIATGHSQSASRLSTYVNSIQPLSHSFDAFALQGSLANRLRVDLEVPVWKVLSEYDVEALEGAVRRPDEGLFRSWEVAGTSHNDRRALDTRVPLQRRDIGTAQEDSLVCTEPIGSTVPFHYVMAAGLDELVRWVTHGTPMPSAPPLVFASGPPGHLARDRFGIALGGIRLSQIAVPIATSSGTNTGPGTCDRWGFTVPFDDATLAALYPRHGRYVSQVAEATWQNLRNGFILPGDAARTISEATRSRIGRR